MIPEAILVVLIYLAFTVVIGAAIMGGTLLVCRAVTRRGNNE